MQPYADALLRFAHAAARRPARDRGLHDRHPADAGHPGDRGRDPTAALLAVAGAVPDWSGGTRLGELLKAFLDRWGQRGARPRRRRRGRVGRLGARRRDLLGEQMRRLHRLAHRVVWVNPHRGRPGYAPMTAGMRPRCRTLTTSSTGTRWPRWSGSRGLSVSEEQVRVHDVFDEIAPVVRRRRAVRAGHGGRHVAQRAAPARGGDGRRRRRRAVGSVSGGCVEGAVYELAQEVSPAASRCCSATASATTTRSRWG